MPYFEVRQTGNLNLSSYSGLVLIGQCCQAAQLEAVIDPKLPVSQGMKFSDIVCANLDTFVMDNSGAQKEHVFLIPAIS